MKDRVTKLNRCTVQLSNGVSFVIVNNFKSLDAPVDSFDAALNNWLARTDEYTPESFIDYVKSKEPNRIFLLESDYKAITEGKVKPATEEEYLSENN